MTEQTLDQRVSFLEFRVDAHDEEIADMHNKAHTLGDSLKAIEATLVQIKWLTVGAGVAFVASNMGFKEALKMLL